MNGIHMTILLGILNTIASIHSRKNITQYAMTIESQQQRVYFKLS